MDTTNLLYLAASDGAIKSHEREIICNFFKRRSPNDELDVSVILEVLANFGRLDKSSFHKLVRERTAMTLYCKISTTPPGKLSVAIKKFIQSKSVPLITSKRVGKVALRPNNGFRVGRAKSGPPFITLGTTIWLQRLFKD